MPSPLQQSCESYRNAADRIDPLTAEHEIAMSSWDVQELIEVGLGLFQSYDRLDSRWRDSIRAADGRHSLDQGVELKGISDMLQETREKVVSLIERLEKVGHVPEGASLFRANVFVPFDDRPLEVPFSEDELRALAGAGGRTPDAI